MKTHAYLFSHLFTSPPPHLSHPHLPTPSPPHLPTPSPPHLLTSPPPHLPHSQVLQKNMQLLMDNVDTLQQDLYRLLGYEKNLAKQQQAKQQFLQRRVRQGLCAHTTAFTVVTVVTRFLPERGECSSPGTRRPSSPSLRGGGGTRAQPAASEPSPSSGGTPSWEAGRPTLPRDYRDCRRHFCKIISLRRITAQVTY